MRAVKFRTLAERVTFCQKNGYTCRAWTGGSDPNNLTTVTGFERTYIAALLRDQMLDCVSYWGELPPRETVRIFLGRARFDAHATCR
jgi:hypothetical protein